MIDFFTSIGSAIITPLYYVTSYILTSFHTMFTSAFGQSPAAQGWSWGLSIICLTIVIRILLIPLFVKQIKSSRNMQLLQPKVKALQKKYGHDREKLAQETMALYKETGTNPFASCLPILLQMPIFLALFRLIDQASKGHPKGVMTEAQAEQLRSATLFGAKISERFIDPSTVNTQILALILVLAMTATTFLTQRQLMSKNMPADAMSGPYAQQQKMLLYVLPVVFAVGGVAFPIGVLLYWTTSNLWTMGQQFYVIRNNPAPGTPAMKAKEDRDARRHKGKAADSDSGDTVVEETPVPPRQQPKKKSRSERRQGQQPAGGQPSQNAQPKKVQPKKVQPKKVQPKKVQPKNAQPKNAQGKNAQGKKRTGKKQPGRQQPKK
ncbi:MAG: membrane protein insertase YidC [Propionibacteriales bacterium]|nr:membrane protein insertase YidC [Propionibacteriales bacterium]